MIRVPNDGNKLVMCPYDATHNILSSRLQVHMIKCRRNHASMEMAQCPFNGTHVLNKRELDAHIKTCPQRQGFELFRVKDELNSEKVSTSEEIISESDMKCDMIVDASLMSNLDDAADIGNIDPDVPSYNPAAYAQAANVLRRPVGLTRSERRAFRAKERERLLKDK